MRPILTVDHLPAITPPVLRRIDRHRSQEHHPREEPAGDPAAQPTARLRDRARRLRDLASQSPGPLAVAYRRRACELDLLDAVTGPFRIDRVV